jgi:hypothetical protein
LKQLRLGLVVEGHGEVKATPLLFRRIAQEIDPTVRLEVLQPIRRPRGSLLRSEERELERAVELAALKVRPNGGVFVLLDSDDDCPAELAPQLLNRTTLPGMGLPVSVVLPKREFEAWFLAAAESLRGKRRLPADLAFPHNPEEVRGAKQWLRDRMSDHTYSETIDQPALTAMFDLSQARRAKSFDKCYRELQLLIERFRG